MQFSWNLVYDDIKVVVLYLMHLNRLVQALGSLLLRGYLWMSRSWPFSRENQVDVRLFSTILWKIELQMKHEVWMKFSRDNLKAGTSDQDGLGLTGRTKSRDAHNSPVNKQLRLEKIALFCFSTEMGRKIGL